MLSFENSRNRFIWCASCKNILPPRSRGFPGRSDCMSKSRTCEQFLLLKAGTRDQIKLESDEEIGGGGGAGRMMRRKERVPWTWKRAAWDLKGKYIYIQKLPRQGTMAGERSGAVNGENDSWFSAHQSHLWFLQPQRRLPQVYWFSWVEGVAETWTFWENSRWV